MAFNYDGKFGNECQRPAVSRNFGKGGDLHFDRELQNLCEMREFVTLSWLDLHDFSRKVPVQV